MKIMIDKHTQKYIQHSTNQCVLIRLLNGECLSNNNSNHIYVGYRTSMSLWFLSNNNSIKLHITNQQSNEPTQETRQILINNTKHNISNCGKTITNSRSIKNR